MNSIVSILEARRNVLKSWKNQIEDPFLRMLAETLWVELTPDAEAFDRLFVEAGQDTRLMIEEQSFLLSLIYLKSSIFFKSEENVDLTAAEKLVPFLPILYRGEYLLALGRACASQGNTDQALEHLKESVKDLNELGAKRRALRADLIKLQVSRLSPEQKLYQLQRLNIEAKARQDREMIAETYFMMAEINAAGPSPITAKKLILKVRALLRSDKSLLASFEARSKELPDLDSNASENKIMVSTKSGSLENLLLELLHEGPKNRYDLIERIWGSSMPTEALENRLKNLLNRVRKKVPGMIQCDNGLYHIVERSSSVKHSLTS